MGYFAAAAMKTTETTPASIPAHASKVLQRLKETQVDELSPREALNILYALKNDMEGES
jgi:hypothetical protein